MGLTPVSDLLPESISFALGISHAATVSPAPQGMTSEVAFVHDRDRDSVLKRCRSPIDIDPATTRWFIHLYEFF